MPQKSVEITPTQSKFRFANSSVQVDLTFTSPLLPKDLALLARPVTIVTYQVKSLTGQPVDVEVSFDATAELAVESLSQEVEGGSKKIGKASTAWLGTTSQPVLEKKGDDLRIDWGRLVVANPSGEVNTSLVDASRGKFTGLYSGSSAWNDKRPADREWPGLSTVTKLGSVNKDGETFHLFIAYDDVATINLFGDHLLPYWRSEFNTFDEMLAASIKDAGKILKQCDAFDKSLVSTLEKDGGPEYAAIASLAYRQSWAAHGLVQGKDGEPLLFSKENYSNGCIATVDVTYPSAPQYLLSGPKAAKALLRPVLDYTTTGRWKFPFAPHDMGTYPHATGQVYGGGEKTEENQMPVEESGNLLILVAAVCEMEKSPAFAKKYWTQLEQWSNYLAEHGIDPGNQLCTDDFAGHLARNANLSIKAILGIGSFAKICEMAGEKELAAKHRKFAEDGVKYWLSKAGEPGKTVLAFGSEGTWSQKYNLVWDELLDLNLFPAELAEKERQAYVGRQNEFGLPLDSRRTYTKLDWILWSACLGNPSNDDFSKFTKPVLKFINETPNRIPLTDWFETSNGHHVGFQARSVVGGVFLRTLQKHSLKQVILDAE